MAQAQPQAHQSCEYWLPLFHWLPLPPRRHWLPLFHWLPWRHWPPGRPAGLGPAQQGLEALGPVGPQAESQTSAPGHGF